MPPKADAVSRKPYWIALATPLVMALPALLVLCLASPENLLGFERACAWGALVCCLTAAWLTYRFLTLIEQKGKEAMRSREALLSGFEQVEQGLPRNAMMTAVLIILGGGAMLLSVSTSFDGRGFLYCVIIAAICVPMGLYTLFRHTYPMLKVPIEEGASRTLGRAITREHAPRVWELVEEVGGRAGVSLPDHIVIGLDTSFYATESPLYVNGVAAPLEGCSLFLSVPYMAYMTREELAVVIGHELAHFTGGDTEHTLKFARIYARVQQHYAAMHLEAKEDEGARPTLFTAPARALIVYFLSQFDLAVQHWSRERKFTADAIGAASVPNPDAAAIALMRTTTLASVIEPVLHEFAYRGGRTEHPGGLLASVFEAVANAKDLDPLKHLEESQPHPRESHPPTRMRIEALGLTPKADLVRAASTREPSGLLEELGLR